MQNVKGMGVMFAECTAFNNGGYPLFLNTCNAQNMIGAFAGCTSLTQSVTINACSVVNICDLFEGCTAFNNGGYPLFLNTCNAQNMVGAFAGCTSLTQLVTIDARRAVHMREMFAGCDKLREPNLLHVPDDVDAENIFIGAPHYAFTGVFSICVS